MRYLRSYTIVIFLILVLIVQSSALGQVFPTANHVVINEADTNPMGDDTKYPIDWVELYNPTRSAVNIGGWTVGATTGLKQIYTVPANTMIQSKQFMMLTSGPLWFPHAGATIQLKSNNGTVIDQTPSLTDSQSGSNSWQRMYDGYDTGSSSDWVFKAATPGSSNGQPPATTASSANTMTVSTDKTSYVFGDTVTISGKVSTLLNNPIQGYPLSVNLIVSGPAGFQKTFTLYPDNNMQFSTSLKASQVTGLQEGAYTVSASYGTVTASTSFTLSSIPFVPPTQASAVTMSVYTDKPSYVLLQPITLSGNVSQVIPLTPVAYKVYDPNGTMIYQGNLYPNTQGHFTTYSQYQSHSSSSGIMINSINPIYGTYNIIATYGTAKSTASFTLVTQPTQSTPVIMSTDKPVYGLGDTVIISGRINAMGLQNNGLNPSLQIVQSFLTSSSGTSQIGNRGIVPNTSTTQTFVNVQSDGTFVYKLTIPGSQSGLGNYRAILTSGFGQAEADFAVAQNPSTYQSTNSPFYITTDKTSYNIGDIISISGQVRNPLSQTGSGGASVNIVVINSTGYTVLTYQNPAANIFVAKNTAPAPLTYYAYPDTNGHFLVTQTLQRGIFAQGNYTLKATYNSLATSASFSIQDPLSTVSRQNIVASIDKQVYGVGDTVHLTGKLSSLTGTSAYTLTLLKPDGGTITAPITLNNGLFSWDWTVPSQAAYNTASTFTTNRASSFGANSQTSLYGIYSITINSDYGNSQLFFQVSPNPQNQTAITPFVIETDKPSYANSDVVNISGQTLPQSNVAAQYSNSQVQISIYTQTGQEAYRYAATLNQGGQFHVSVPMQPGAWTAGTYKIYAQYLTYSSTIRFDVTNPYVVGSGPLQLFITTDHEKYLPGQTVLITGRTSYIISVDNTYLTFGLANDTIVSEGQAVSKMGNTLQHATARFDQYGSFSYNYAIPKSAAVGNYTVVAQVPFGSYNAYYQVVNQLPVENTTSVGNVTQTTNATQVTPPPANATQAPQELTVIPTSIGPTQKSLAPYMIVDKENMISDSAITINLSEKTTGNQTYYPREIDGLLRVNPEDENLVSMKINSPDGTCIIGLTADCKISQSTYHMGSSYQNVQIGNESFLVGYSGANQRIQQFSILPTNANDSITDGQWHANIIKNNQVSRFYYQVTYVAK
ncbi:MAG: lamin tail domain-containing protein [Thaumarchaeota archaeon]|nr:lamin tail domain-containing protein [Nitrososphaerota archaeon]